MKVQATALREPLDAIKQIKAGSNPGIQFRRLCPVCSADLDNWAEVFHEEHHCPQEKEK